MRILMVILLMLSLQCFGQVYAYKAIQYELLSSGDTQPAYRVFFNHYGREIRKIYICNDGSTYEEINDYKDTVLLMRLQIHEANEKTKIIYSYDRKGRLKKEVTFYYRPWEVYKKRVSSDEKKDSIIAWKKVGEQHYKYDRKNNKIRQDQIPKRDHSRTYLYKYDSLNRLVKEYAYLGGKKLLSEIKFYTYNDSGIKIISYYFGSSEYKKPEKYYYKYALPKITIYNYSILEKYRYPRKTYDAIGRLSGIEYPSRRYIYVYED